jgi:hypothetical protein
VVKLDRIRFGLALDTLLPIYGLDRWTAEVIGTYYEAVEDLDGDLVMKAIKALLQEKSWMPKPAEVRDRVSEIKSDTRPPAFPLPDPKSSFGQHNDDPRLCNRNNCESLGCQSHVEDQREQFHGSMTKILSPEQRLIGVRYPGYLELIGLHEMRHVAVMFLKTPEGLAWIRSHKAPVVRENLEAFEQKWCR